MSTFTFENYSFLKPLGLASENHGAFYGGKWTGSGDVQISINPSTKQQIASTKFAGIEDYNQAMDLVEKAKVEWMTTPMPVRGEIVRQIGQAFRDRKEDLGRLVSLEMGKILSEGLGQVQEAIDICDFACGLSRQIGGAVLPSERPNHFMMQVWNPIGIVGVITAFNFPCAVFAWNAAVALVCGNLIVWKGSPTTSLITIAVTNIIQQVLKKNNINPAVVTTIQGGTDIGVAISKDTRIGLVSFTGSTKVGKIVQQQVNNRFGKTILQLGGNNATVVMDDADVELAIKAATFAAVGTCGQRCTSLRRLLIHSSLYDNIVQKLVKTYPSIPIGDPLDSKTLCGPLHCQMSVDIYTKGIEEIKKQGGKILVGGNVLTNKGNGFFVEPTIVEISSDAAIIKEQLFCPILYVLKFDTLQEAIKMNNSVPQGLSSSLITKNIANLYQWTGPLGSDCGIVNINMGPSGAEIGGAFGGQKETGGGRQSGSDSWKQYMRRVTSAINYGKVLPLAQGVVFDI